MEQEKIALIDMDGSIADYNAAMLYYLMQMASPMEPEIPENFHTAPDYIEARCNVIKRQPGFWENLAVIPLGFGVVNKLKELSYTLIVLTKGPTKTTTAWTEKRNWCHKYLPDIPVTVTESKNLVYGKVLFDDYPPYIEGWLEHRPRGKVLMLNQPWNAKFEHPAVMRISSQQDIDKIEKFLT